MFNKYLFLAIIIVKSGVESNEDILNRNKRGFLWPGGSVMQIAMALVTPIWVEHKIFINVGFNVNYNLPATLNQFTKPAFVPGLFTKRSIDHAVAPIDSQWSVENPSLENKYNNGTRIQGDVSAGEMYAYLQELLSLKGHHSECLLHMVCDYARMPFHIDEAEDNLMHEIIHLFLTPSEHQAFDENEKWEKERYEQAEQLGRNDEDCSIHYPLCDTAPLDDFTDLMED